MNAPAQNPPATPAGPPGEVLLIFGSVAWAVLAWCLALLAPRIAFWPLAEALHLALPCVTGVLIVLNLAWALRRLWRGDAAAALLVSTTVQVVLFTVLFFQLAAHLGAEHYRLDRAPTTLDWAGFALAHAVRASDVLDTVEAFGLRIQAVRHQSWLIGGILVAYHLVVNVFVLALLAALWARGQRWVLATRQRRAWAYSLLGFYLVSALLAVVSFSLMGLLWDPQDTPWWLAENALRTLDTVDCFDCFNLRLHQVPNEGIVVAVTLWCRIYLALGLGVLVGLVSYWRAGRTEEEPTPMNVTLRPVLASLCLALACGGAFLYAAHALPAGAALPGLTRAVEEPDEARCGQALAALRRLGVAADSCVGDLERALQTAPDPRRREIVRTLGHLGQRSADGLARLALGDEEALALAAVGGLRRIGPAAAPHLVRVWATSSAEAVRANAERHLATLGPEAVPPLMETATSENLPDHLYWIQTWERNWALRATTNEVIEQAKELPTLVERLNDPRDREGAAHALGRIGPAARDAVPALVACLRDGEDSVRAAAAEALGKIGPAAKLATPALVERLADGDPWVRKAAADALGRIGPAARDAVPALIERLADPDGLVRAEAATALGRIGPAAQAAIPALLERVRDLSAQEAAVKALGRIGPAAVAALITASADQDAAVRKAAVEALGEIGPAAKDAVPALVERLKDFSAREAAATALGRIGPAAVPTLVEALADGNDFVRWDVTIALRILGPAARDAVPALIERLADRDPHVRGGAANALGEIGPAAKVAVPVLIERLEDREAEVRLCAAVALGNLGPLAKEAVPALRRRLELETDDYAKNAARNALRSLEAP